MPLNIEFKARCSEPERVRVVLRQMNARFAGVDNQTDTYFSMPSGRLKLREGNIENNLIYYRRQDNAPLKQSDVWLAPFESADPIRELLATAFGVRCVVKKRREIYFHENTKIHVDDVPGLGSFVEVEVIADAGEADLSTMQVTCDEWKQRLDVNESDLVFAGYSDMVESL
jgi:adenylate cyclase class 2